VRTDDAADGAAAERLAVGEVVGRDGGDERRRVSYISTDITVCTSTAYLCVDLCQECARSIHLIQQSGSRITRHNATLTKSGPKTRTIFITSFCSSVTLARTFSSLVTTPSLQSHYIPSCHPQLSCSGRSDSELRSVL
jgi:hypothetical protein